MKQNYKICLILTDLLLGLSAAGFLYGHLNYYAALVITVVFGLTLVVFYHYYGLLKKRAKELEHTYEVLGGKDKVKSRSVLAKYSSKQLTSLTYRKILLHYLAKDKEEYSKHKLELAHKCFSNTVSPYGDRTSFSFATSILALNIVEQDVHHWEEIDAGLITDKGSADGLFEYAFGDNYISTINESIGCLLKILNIDLDKAVDTLSSIEGYDSELRRYWIKKDDDWTVISAFIRTFCSNKFLTEMCAVFDVTKLLSPAEDDKITDACMDYLFQYLDMKQPTLLDKMCKYYFNEDC